MNKSYIPNAFTFGNLACGVLSIVFSMKGELAVSSILIISAAILDRYDGKIARMFNASSSVGKELDSLADLISFGVAPSIISWVLFLNEYNILGYILICLFPICGAYRLARYNITEFHEVFMGIPITIAGFIMAIDSLVNIYIIKHYLISTLFFILLSYLMVSKIKIKKM